jgi:hypothetical protein
VPALSPPNHAGARRQPCRVASPRDPGPRPSPPPNPRLAPGMSQKTPPHGIFWDISPQHNSAPRSPPAADARLAAPAEPGTQVTGWAAKASTKQSDRQFIDTCCVYPARQRLKSTLHPRCHHRRRMTRGQDGSLLLSCGALASPTSCRFIPALSLRPLLVSLFVSQPVGCLALRRLEWTYQAQLAYSCRKQGYFEARGVVNTAGTDRQSPLGLFPTHVLNGGGRGVRSPLDGLRKAVCSDGRIRPTSRSA